MEKTLESVALITSTIKEIVKGFTYKRSILGGLIIAITIFMILTVFEHYTGYFYFSRIDKKINTLQKLKDLEIKDECVNFMLEQEIESVLIYMSEYDVVKTENLIPNFLTSNNVTFSNEGYFKFLSGLIIPVIIVLIGFKDDDRKNILVGGIFIGLITGFIAVLIPTIYNIWFNIIFIPIIQGGVLIYYSTKKKT